MPGAGAPWGRPKGCKDRSSTLGMASRPQTPMAVAPATLPTVPATPSHPSPACSRVSEPPWPVTLSFLVAQLQLMRPLLIFST